MQQRPISHGNGAAMADRVVMAGRFSSKGGKNSSGSCSGSGSDSQQMEGSHFTGPELDSGTRSTSLGSDEQPSKEQVRFKTFPVFVLQCSKSQHVISRARTQLPGFELESLSLDPLLQLWIFQSSKASSPSCIGLLRP